MIFIIVKNYQKFSALKQCIICHIPVLKARCLGWIFGDVSTLGFQGWDSWAGHRVLRRNHWKNLLLGLVGQNSGSCWRAVRLGCLFPFWMFLGTALSFSRLFSISTCTYPPPSQSNKVQPSRYSDTQNLSGFSFCHDSPISSQGNISSLRIHAIWLTKPRWYKISSLFSGP